MPVLIRAALFLLCVLALGACEWKQGAQLRWHVIHVSGDHSSGDAHLLELPNGKRVLIDTGYEVFTEPVLLPYLRKLGVEQLDLAVITHAHKNHYGGLLKLQDEVAIKTLAFSKPDASVCATEKKGDRCNAEHVDQVIERLSNNTKVISTQTGQDLLVDSKNNVRLSVLHQAMSLDDPRYSSLANAGAKFTINDSSAVLKLEFGEQSILFPGDVSETTGRFLSDSDTVDLSATLLAAPHHGVSPLPTRGFFEKVSPEAIVVSISNPPFDGERGADVREYAKSSGIPIYVTGKTGSLLITLDGQQTFSVATEAQDDN